MTNPAHQKLEDMLGLPPLSEILAEEEHTHHEAHTAILSALKSLETHWKAAEELKDDHDLELQLHIENLLDIDDDNPYYAGTDSLVEAINDTLDLLYDEVPSLEQRERMYVSVLGHLNLFEKKQKEHPGEDIATSR